MSSQANKEQFIKQLETIQDGIKNNLSKVSLLCIKVLFDVFSKKFIFILK